MAGELRNSGASDFVIDCLDLSQQMLERGRALAAQEGVAEHIHPICGDLNHWQPDREYDAVLANHALHHVLRLEPLFDGIHRSLSRNGVLIASDMIGRNGHRRWPEALVWVQQFWQELPPPYRFNRQLERQETDYPDWDCSADGMGFEGIRAQDILPLLIERFRFQFFYAFSNVTDPFIDRSFGPNFDPRNPWDRQFIDRVHACDEAEIGAGRIKPTHMLAVLRREQAEPLLCMGHRTPEFCVRRP
ncbi:MAG TPA: class I SAM-dependent methyltransferase [Bryobacteraceae bacterium]|nr:class I SAM-dependent methyltransferase [Bryobacteraceae bacterium]